MPPQQITPQQPSYDFIVNPAQPGSRSLYLGNSPKQRLLVVAGGFLILIILVIIVTKALSGGGGWANSFVDVAQQQQALISLSGDVTTNNSQAQLSAGNNNVASTVALAVASSQSQLLTYMKTNGQKVSTKELGLKVNPQTQQQLTSAVTSGNYDSTFQSLLQSQLNSYQLALKQAYAKAPGPKGRQLLSDDYNQANLMLTQLKQAGS